MDVAVVGAGSWGTALALLLARNGHEVRLYGRDRDEIDAIRLRRENMRYLAGFALPKEIEPRWMAEGMEPAELWVMAVPSAAVREVLPLMPDGPERLAVASKGLAPGDHALLTDVVAERFPSAHIGVISGPNLAIELARGVPTAAIAACADTEEAERLSRAFTCRTYRVYITEDVVGVELAGALKNILAIAAGMSDGLGFGDNTKGALLARGLRDMLRLGTAMGGCFETFLGIAGVGDLFATASSKLSRNYRVGVALGEGRSLMQALHEIGQVAEGVGTTEAAVALGRRHGVELPIFAATQMVLAGRTTPRDAVAQLMERQTKREEIIRP